MVNRNDPCPCGGGKRYKRCCGELASSATDPASTLQQIMLAALARQQDGFLPDAERLHRQALAIAPAEPAALHMLGVIHFQTGRLWEGFALIRRALDITAWTVPTMRHNLALVLKHLLPGDDVLPRTRRSPRRNASTQEQPQLLRRVHAPAYWSWITRCRGRTAIPGPLALSRSCASLSARGAG